MGRVPDTGRIENILGMRAIWDALIKMDDGLDLRADIFLPQAQGSDPAIIASGPYGKGVAFQDAYKSSWDRMAAAYPDIAKGSTCTFQTRELVDPEKWVPDGYA